MSLDESASGQPAATPVIRRSFILGLLAIGLPLLCVGLYSAVSMEWQMSSRYGRIKLEIDVLDHELREYQLRASAYPPCDLRLTAENIESLQKHVALAFPQYDIEQLPGDLPLTGVDTDQFRPDQALVFWLRGFSPDPRHPFVTVNDEQIVDGKVSQPGTKVSRECAFDFDPARLAAVPTPDSPGAADSTRVMPSYFPIGIAPTGYGTPFVYFDAAHYALPGSGQGFPPVPTAWSPFEQGMLLNAGTVQPYFEDSNRNGNIDAKDTWANPKSVQIILSGLDLQYGAKASKSRPILRLYPTGVGYDPDQSDDDNVANFSTGLRLIDKKP